MSKADRAEQQLNRRMFFVEVQKKIKLNAALSIEHLLSQNSVSYIRPPGATEEFEFINLCSRCGKCQEACPNSAIMSLTEESTLVEMGTPYLEPEETPCSFCLKCIEVCPTGALNKDNKLRIGIAEIDKTTCMAWQGVYCGNCAHYCDYQGVKIVDKKPVVDQEKCNGCGKCAERCFASPKAIEIKGGNENE